MTGRLSLNNQLVSAQCPKCGAYLDLEESQRNGYLRLLCHCCADPLRLRIRRSASRGDEGLQIVLG